MKKKRSIPQKRKDDKRINQQIIANEVTVISDDGESLGRMSLSEALSIAE